MTGNGQIMTDRVMSRMSITYLLVSYSWDKCFSIPNINIMSNRNDPKWKTDWLKHLIVMKSGIYKRFKSCLKER